MRNSHARPMHQIIADVEAKNKRYCWIIGSDADTGQIRPSYVLNKDAEELQVKCFEDYESCLIEANILAAEHGRTCCHQEALFKIEKITNETYNEKPNYNDIANTAAKLIK